MPELNQSARDSLALARELGGTPFVDFVVTMQPSIAMNAHVFPELIQHRVRPEIARICDKAFLIGLYEAWARLTGAPKTVRAGIDPVPEVDPFGENFAADLFELPPKDRN